MSHHYYRVCCSNMGRNVRIRTRDGRFYTGRISRVTPHHVYLSPSGRGISAREGKEHHPIVTTADSQSKKAKGTDVFFGFGIIPLAAIAGLTIVGTAPFWGGWGRRYGAYGAGYGVRRPGVW